MNVFKECILNFFFLCFCDVIAKNHKILYNYM